MQFLRLLSLVYNNYYMHRDTPKLEAKICCLPLFVTPEHRGTIIGFRPSRGT